MPEPLTLEDVARIEAQLPDWSPGDWFPTTHREVRALCALAREALEQRERVCGTCRHWDRFGDGFCWVQPTIREWPADHFCAAWEAKGDSDGE